MSPEPHFDTKSREDIVELGVRTSVEIAGRDDIVASLGEVDNGIEYSTRARAKSKSGKLMCPLKKSNP